MASVALSALSLGCSGDSRRYQAAGSEGGHAGSIGAAGSGDAVESGGRVGAAGAPDPGTAGTGLTSSDGGVGGGGEPADACLDATKPPDAPLRLLRNVEYDNTFRAWGDPSQPAQEFPVEIPGEFYISALHVEQYFEAARDFARRVTADAAAVAEFAGCDPAVDGEATCRQTFIREFIGRAFRRPATEIDIADFDAVFEQGQALGGDFASGVRAVVEVALQSPEFLYRVELGEPLDADAVEGRMAGWARPTPYEMATRLSFFIWGAPPDAALLEAASQGELRDKDEIAAEARRMLDDERARATVRRFYFELLRLRSSSELPTLEPELAQLAVAETEHFIDAVTWEEPGDFSALLTAPFTFVNEQLAYHYGIAGVSGDAMQRVALDPSRRAGILTQASFLASTSISERTSPTHRGLRIFTQLLCRTPLTPPVGVVVVPPEPLPESTYRERLEAETAEPVCAGCHAVIDPLGFAFEHYDWAGRFRETENGLPIDATGSLESSEGIVEFDGALELAAALAQSDEAQQCFVDQWMKFVHGRALTDADACSRQRLDQAFAEANGNVRELLVALTQTDAFLYRPALPEQP